SDDTVYRALKELGFSHVSARPKAYKQDPEAVEAFQKTFPPAWHRSARSLRPKLRKRSGCRTRWRYARRTSSTNSGPSKDAAPRTTHDQRTQSTYLFGAVCPELGTGAALVLPACNSEAMQLHLNEIATKITPGAHAILLLDQAGWHGAKTLKVPSNITF